MIPSDHFPRFYNEVFKFLATQGNDALEAYWLKISEHQEHHTLDLFREKGLDGMAQYWSNIRKEENCDLDIDVTDDTLTLTMNKCPSLTKALDNDAGAMDRYCDHCAGWIGPIVDKLDYHLVYDVIDRTKPVCKMQIFANAEKAIEAELNAALSMDWPGRKKPGS